MSAMHARAVRRTRVSHDVSGPARAFDEVDMSCPLHPPPWDGSDHADVAPEGDLGSARTLGGADPTVDTVLAQDFGDVVGLSRERVRRLEQQAFARLRQLPQTAALAA